MKCINCKKEIKNFDKACYSRETNVALCSLDCLTDYAHEYLRCVPLPLENSELPSEAKPDEKDKNYGTIFLMSQGYF